MDEASVKAITQLDLLDQIVATDQAFEMRGSPFVGGMVYGHDLSEYEAPMLLPDAVKRFIRENDQTLKTAEIRPSFDNKRLATLSLGLSSNTQIVIEPIPESDKTQARHINRHGAPKDIGWATNAEIGKFITGLPMQPVTRKMLALKDEELRAHFEEVITSHDLWLLASEATQDSADYTIFERAYPLRLEEVDPNSYFSTAYSGLLSTQLRPTSLRYSLALRSTREIDDRIQVTNMNAVVQINDHAEADKNKLSITVHGTTGVIIPGEAAPAPEQCNKPAVANFLIEFLRKATPLVPKINIVYQRGLPDVADQAPRIDEYIGDLD